jgi:hypothetical protein
MKCQQLGVWDAGRAGTYNRKKSLGGGGLRAGIDIQGEEDVGRGKEQMVRRLKWGLPQYSNHELVKGFCVRLGEWPALWRAEGVASVAIGEMDIRQ